MDSIIAGLVPVAIAGAGLFLRDRDKAAKDEIRIAQVEQEIKNIRHSIGSVESKIPFMIEAALNKWELGFRDRLNGQYAKNMVAGVTAQVEALSHTVEKFHDELPEKVRHEVRSAMQALAAGKTGGI